MVKAMLLNIQKQFCMFSVILIIILSNCSVDGRTIRMKNYKDIMIPEDIVQCRASCIERFLFEVDDMVTVSSCQRHSNCAMCWDFCQTLFVAERSILKSICTNYTCLKGCKYACRYYNYKSWLNSLTINGTT